jgi:hypothetical protein
LLFEGAARRLDELIERIHLDLDPDRMPCA